ncbi:MAG: AAA family ATPase [Byssovorax sp.]
MLPSFNTAGPCVPGEHYMLPPERRLGRVMQLIEERKFFTLQSGRQTGKTTSAKWLARHYNQGDRYCAIWVDIQTAREEPDPVAAFRTVLGKLDHAVKTWLGDVAIPSASAELRDDPKTAVQRYLQDLAARCPRPLVVLIDEADGLVGPSMVSFLTQLRDGYVDRETTPFPHSVVLISSRAVHDDVVESDHRRRVSWPATSSAFELITEAASLDPFTRDEVEQLPVEHTAATGQRFEPEAIAAIHDLSQGHPWIANALAGRVVDHDLPDRTVPVTLAHVEAAKEAILREPSTHLDLLRAKLDEPRVRRILDPMIAGERTRKNAFEEDFAYAIDHGLLRVRRGRFEIANPICAEVILQSLMHPGQQQIHHEPADYVRADGALDRAKIMADWQIFWRENGHLAAEGFSYRESGPHLMLMAFLQRIVNGGGKIEREYGLGRGALDLVIHWHGTRHAIEVKLRRDTQTEKRALEQAAGYLDTIGLDEGWLVMFDLRARRSWKQRLTSKISKTAGKRIHVIGC